jgi:hypothetical protein
LPVSGEILGAPHRILAIGAKERAPQRPGIAVDYTLKIVLGAVGSQYVEFSAPRAFGTRHGPEIDAVGLEGLAAGYFLELTQEALVEESYGHHYAGVLSNANLPRACEALLQLGIRAQIVLAVRNRSTPICTMAIATSREASHVLGQFFSEVRRVRERWFRKVAQGKIMRPVILTALTLPRLPGMDQAKPLPVEIPIMGASDGITIGQVLSPYHARPVGPAVLSKDRMMRGVLVAGTTGSGKTNTILQIVRDLHKEAWILFFDVKRE